MQNITERIAINQLLETRVLLLKKSGAWVCWANRMEYENGVEGGGRNPFPKRVERENSTEILYRFLTGPT